MAREAKDLTFDEIRDAVVAAHGIYGSACKYVQSMYGICIQRKELVKYIQDWGLEEYIDSIRKQAVEGALHRTIAKGIEEGDNAALFWFLNKYGHHADFLAPQGGEEGESKDGWKQILQAVRSP